MGEGCVPQAKDPLPVAVVLGSVWCIAYNPEVFVAHPKGCEDRPPVQRQGEVWMPRHRSRPQYWIRRFKLASDQDATTNFILPHSVRVHKSHECVYKACILAASRKTPVHAWWCPAAC